MTSKGPMELYTLSTFYSFKFMTVLLLQLILGDTPKETGGYVGEQPWMSNPFYKNKAPLVLEIPVRNNVDTNQEQYVGSQRFHA